MDSDNKLCKIYIITSGEYSDYHILGATTDETIANGFSEKWRATVEEYDILTSTDLDFIKNKKQYEVVMNKNGDSEFGYASEEGNLKTVWYFWRDPSYRANNELKMRLTVWADSKEHAIKIANEYRIQFIASGEWDKQENNPDV